MISSTTCVFYILLNLNTNPFSLLMLRSNFVPTLNSYLTLYGIIYVEGMKIDKHQKSMIYHGMPFLFNRYYFLSRKGGILTIDDTAFVVIVNAHSAFFWQSNARWKIKFLIGHRMLRNWSFGWSIYVLSINLFALKLTFLFQ